VINSAPILQTDSSRCRENFRDANQIGRRCRQNKEPFHQAASAIGSCASRPPSSSTRKVLRAFALDRADAIAGMASRARIDRRPAVGVVLRDLTRLMTRSMLKISQSDLDDRLHNAQPRLSRVRHPNSAPTSNFGSSRRWSRGRLSGRHEIHVHAARRPAMARRAAGRVGRLR
jgi:hypothetical protein